MNIAFIGLGNMGAPMASNLVKAGHSVTVFDLVESAMQALESEGASRAASAEAAAREAEVIISMLPAGAHVKGLDRKSTRLNSSHVRISYAVFCLKKKKNKYAR